jgi:SAM-dependent methyltransferase
VDQTEMVALILPGLSPLRSGIWADLGAGSGNFTAALRTLLAADATIYALDRDPAAVVQLHALSAQPGATIRPMQADFTRPLELPLLEGALLANVLHFVRRQAPALARIGSGLRPGGRLLLVEYDLALPRPWVPFPIAAERFAALAREAGFQEPAIIGRRRSPRTGVTIYAAMASRPQS